MSGEDSDRISGAELRVWLDWLGLRQADATALLQVGERTLRAWLTERDPIPYRVGDELQAFEDATTAVVIELVEQLQDMRDPAAVVYRTDDEVPGRYPVQSASWWRMVVARASVAVPGVEMHYSED